MNVEAKKALLGKYAVLRADVLREEYRNMGTMLILVGGGSFAPESWLYKDNVCTVAADGHIQCWNWEDIERLATEEEIEAHRAIKKIQTRT